MPIELMKDFIDKQCKITLINEQLFNKTRLAN